MRLILLLPVMAVLILLLALALLWLPLPAPFPAPGSHARNLPAAIITGSVGLVGLSGWLLYAISLFAQAGRVLDPALGPAGLTSQSYMLFGRAYHGTLRGRTVEVYYQPSRGPWPALLDVHVSANLPARAAIGLSRPWLDCRDCPRVELQEQGLDQLEVYTQDAVWVKRLAAAPQGRAALERLMFDQAISGFRELAAQSYLAARPSHAHCAGAIPSLARRPVHYGPGG